MSVIEDVLADNAIYAGCSRYTGTPVYVAPVADTAALTLQEALELAEETSRATGQRYRLPTRGELSLLFKASLAAENEWHWTNHAGGFNGDPMCVRDHHTATHPSTFRHRVRLVRDI